MEAELDLQRQLEPLGGRHRIAFAASCCERILPAYERFSSDDGWGDAGPLREALDRIWASVLGRLLEQQEARDLATRCEPQIHHLDDPFESVFTAPAQSAAIAVLTAVDCAVDGDLELATKVGELALDTVEAYVDATEGQGAVFDPDLITSSRLFRDEIACEQVDLATLAEHRELDAGLVERLRERSSRAELASIARSRR